MATINKDTWIEDVEIPLIDFNLVDLYNRDERIETNTDFVNTVRNGDFTGIRIETAGLTVCTGHIKDIDPMRTCRTNCSV